MLCQNCKEQEANVKYTQIINGVKKEMVLCQDCAKKMGIEEEFKFDMPMDLPSFLGGFLGDYNATGFMPSFGSMQQMLCDHCGMTYDEFVNTGKLGCSDCYDVFADRIDPILKNIHGMNRHVGRKGRLLEKGKKEIVQNKKEEVTKEPKEKSELERLKEDLKKAIKEERYEEAAKIRDAIKKIEGEN